MGRLIYSLSVSQDGYAADAAGSLDWVTVDEELHAAFNDETRPRGTPPGAAGGYRSDDHPPVE